jgi:hypothetical protein
MTLNMFFYLLFMEISWTKIEKEKSKQVKYCKTDAHYLYLFFQVQYLKLKLLYSLALTLAFIFEINLLACIWAMSSVLL